MFSQRSIRIAESSAVEESISCLIGIFLITSGPPCLYLGAAGNLFFFLSVCLADLCVERVGILDRFVIEEIISSPI